MKGRNQLFFRMLLKAVWVRKDRALTALISVAVVATIATAALTVYSDLENKLSREFTRFGANVVVTKKAVSKIAAGTDKSSNSPNELEKISALLGPSGEAVPVAYAIATAQDGSKLVVGGADLKQLRQLNAWWSIADNKSADTNLPLVGARVEDKLAHDQALTIKMGETDHTIGPHLVFRSGSDDDSRIYIDLPTFVAWTGVQPNTVLLRVPGKPQEIQSAIDRLSTALPLAEVKPVRQITQAQTSVIGKTRSVVFAASAIVLVLIMLTMVATFTSSVLERRKDFAVMKALGASNRTVNVMFASEAAVQAIAGATIGYILGCGIAFWIGKANFEAAIWPQPMLLLPVLLGSMLLALGAATAPLRLLQQIQPAGILRGE
jgi:putative ABC transport system permease protein